MTRPVGSLDLESPGQSCRIGKMAKTFTSISPHYFMGSMLKLNVEKTFILVSSAVSLV